MAKMPALNLKHTSLKIAEHLLDDFQLHQFLTLHPLVPAGGR
jgi:hypothetical protein